MAANLPAAIASAAFLVSTAEYPAINKATLAPLSANLIIASFGVKSATVTPNTLVANGFTAGPPTTITFCADGLATSSAKATALLGIGLTTTEPPVDLVAAVVPLTTTFACTWSPGISKTTSSLEPWLFGSLTIIPYLVLWSSSFVPNVCVLKLPAESAPVHNNSFASSEEAVLPNELNNEELLPNLMDILSL